MRRLFIERDDDTDIDAATEIASWAGIIFEVEEGWVAFEAPGDALSELDDLCGDDGLCQVRLFSPYCNLPEVRQLLD